MSRLFSSGLRLALVTAVALTVASVTAAASMTAASAAKVRSLQIESVVIDQDRVVGGEGFSGTVTLNQVAPTDVQVIAQSTDTHPDYAVVQGNPIVIPAGSSSATFTGTTTTPDETDRIVIDAILADGTSSVDTSDDFVLVPTAQTDLITVTKATMSKSGKLTVSAVSDDPTAVLSATYNGEVVPGESSGGKFRGQLQFDIPTSGIVEVRSDLGGCAQRNPFGSSGSDDCIP
jgi:hypothetical protein